MNYELNQMNVSITTNRSCTLRCSHCYIQPQLFKDKTIMTERTYKSIFDNIEKLLDASPGISQVEWEVVGGETTMLPFEWWEKMLPWTFDRIDGINKRFKDEGVLHYLTNLMYRDERYTGLFSEYGHHPLLCLYTSWEPDTGRFGKNNKLFDKFYSRLCSIDGHHKTLNVLLSKAVIEIGAKPILDLFVPAGITDFSMQMIYPYGSGEAFFRENNPSYADVSNFLIDFDTLKPREISFTPQEEFFSSLHAGAVTQWNGNSRYDLSIDMDGSITFNPNLTGTQAARPSKKILLDDAHWPLKVAYENKQEEVKKHTLPYEKCNQCEYVNYCNGGWFLHKDLEQISRPLGIGDECSGLKLFWDHTKKSIGSSTADTIMLTNSKRIRALFSGGLRPAKLSEIIREADFSELDSLMGACKAGLRVEVVPFRHIDKNPLERIMFYIEIGMIPVIRNGFIGKIKEDEQDAIADIFINLFSFFEFDGEGDLARYITDSNTAFSNNIKNIAGAIRFIDRGKVAADREDLFNKGKYDELCRIVSYLSSLGESIHFKTISVNKKDRDFILLAMSAIASEQCFVGK